MLGEIKRGRYSTNKLTGVKGNRISFAKRTPGKKRQRNSFDGEISARMTNPGTIL